MGIPSGMPPHPCGCTRHAAGQLLSYAEADGKPLLRHPGAAHNHTALEAYKGFA